jgi:hypothetical protein
MAEMVIVSLVTRERRNGRRFAFAKRSLNRACIKILYARVDGSVNIIYV